MREGFNASGKCGQNVLECRVTGYRNGFQAFLPQTSCESKITLEIGHIQSLQFTSEHELYIMNLIKPNLIS